MRPQFRIEYHILQSFPVSCLNRDDVGAPKSAMVGGYSRARVSSQCWKRQVRLALHELGVKSGTRTKLIAGLIADACMQQGASYDQAVECGAKIEQIFIKKTESIGKGKKKDGESDDQELTTSEAGKSDTLLFLSPNEVQALAIAFRDADFDPAAVIRESDAKKQVKELVQIIGKTDEYVDALDVALFGRMVAQAASMNVEAAACFSHALSTHEVVNELDFFTSMDDRQGAVGASHMGAIEYNSATYYRYISLDIGQLAQTLGPSADLAGAIEAFTRALFVAVPSARQATLSGASPWEFAKVLVRRGQRLQVPFEAPIKADRGYLRPSIAELKSYLAKKEKLSGSLFGKIGDYEWGENENFSVDDLISALQSHLE